MQVQAIVHAGRHEGLQVICRIKSIPIVLRQGDLLLGPCSLDALLPALMTWLRQHAGESRASAVRIRSGQSSRFAAASRVGLEWHDVRVEDEWSRLLLQAPEGFAEWDELEARRLSRPVPSMPAVWFGRQEELALTKRKFEGSSQAVLLGQPLIGRSTFARAFAAFAFNDWIDGTEFIDLESDSALDRILGQTPQEISSAWRQQHKLFILDNASSETDWLRPLLRLLSAGRSLCSLLIIPNDGFIEPGLPRITLGPLDEEAFQKLWVFHFGEASQDHIDRMNERTGRVPGVVPAVQRQFGRRTPSELESAFDHNYSRQQPLLQKLGGRIGSLSSMAARRLRVLSLCSAQFSMRLALEPMGEDTASLHEVGELLTAGWMVVEEDCYRIPRPYALAARLALHPGDDDLLMACQSFLSEARCLADIEGDLMPPGTSRAFLHLLWTSWEPLRWLTAQVPLLDLALEAAVLLWLPALKHGYSKDYLSATHLIAQQVRHLPPSRLTPIFWEGRGRHFRAQGKLKEGLECYDLGISQAKELGLMGDELWNLQFKASTLSVMGETQRAGELFKELIQRRRAEGKERELAHALCALALHSYRHGRLDVLAQLLVEANTLGVMTKARDVLVVNKEILGWIRLSEGDTARAKELFAEAELLGEPSVEFRRDQVGAGRALVEWRSGNRLEALSMVCAMEERPERVEALPLMLLRMNKASMLLLLGDSEKGAEAARSCFEMMISIQALVWMGDILDLAALAAWKTGGSSSSAILAGCAFHWQSQYGWRGSPIKEELNSWRQECREQLGSDAFQARYLAGSGLDPIRLLELCRVDFSLVSQLLPDLVGGKVIRKALATERQMEVLRLTSQGMSNRQIAKALILEEGTVKRHLHNLSTELGASGRLQLVKKARDLGLLP